MNIIGIQGDYSIPKGYVFAKFAGDENFQELGDTDAVDITVEVERDERMDNRFGVARVADSNVTSINVSVAMTLVQGTNLNRSLGVMGSNLVMTQAAEEGVVKTLEAAKARQFYDLGGFNLADLVVTDGAAIDPVVQVLGTDYAIDTASGVFQPLKDGKFEITFDKPAITNASNRLKTGIGGNPDIQCELLIVGSNSSGAKVHVRLWKVRLTPSGARSYISESERGTFEIEGTVMADDARALAEGDKDEFAFGVEQTLADTAS